MKTKAQKKVELAKGEKLAEKSEVLVFTDFSRVTAEDLRRLRRDLRAVGADYLVIKKRLLGIILKNKKVDFDQSKFKISIGTVFGNSDLEKISATVVKFFKTLEAEGLKKVLGGYNLKNMEAISQEKMVYIGSLPPKEVLLGQLFGMLRFPIQSLLFVMQEKSKRS